MKTSRKSIVVDTTPTACYEAWRKFEDFPRFMEGVQEVRKTGDGTYHWVAQIDGQGVEWDARVTRQESPRIIAWESIGGAANHGQVEFRSEGPNRCRVDLTLRYEPEGATQNLGAWLGAVDARIQGDLERFRDYVTGAPPMTGTWQRRGGRAAPSEVSPTAPEPGY